MYYSIDCTEVELLPEGGGVFIGVSDIILRLRSLMPMFIEPRPEEYQVLSFSALITSCAQAHTQNDEDVRD